jgi:hypothetical protein
MYVVRIIVDDDQSDFKVFDRLETAKERFDAGWLQTEDGEFNTIAIFDVTDVNGPAEAVAAVKRGDKERVQLREFHESSDIRLTKLLPKLRIDL